MKKIGLVFFLIFLTSKSWCEENTSEVELSANFTATFDLKANQIRLFNLPAKEGHNGVIRITSSQEIILGASCRLSFVHVTLTTEAWSYCEASDSKELYIEVSSPVDVTQVNLKVERFPTIEINYNEEHMFDQYNATNGYVYFKVKPQANYGNSIRVITNNVTTSQRTVTKDLMSMDSLDTEDELPVWYILAKPKVDSFSILVTTTETIDLPDVPETVLTVNYLPGDYQAYRYRGGIGKNAALKYKTITRITVSLYGTNWVHFLDNGKTRYVFFRSSTNMQNWQNGTITLSKANFEPGYFNTDLSYQCQTGALRVIQFPQLNDTDYVVASQNATSTQGLWEIAGSIIPFGGNFTNRRLVIAKSNFLLRVMCANNRTYSARVDAIPSLRVKDGDVVTVDLNSKALYIPIKEFNTLLHGPESLVVYVDVEGASPDNVALSSLTRTTGNSFFGYKKVMDGFDWIVGVSVSAVETVPPKLTFHFRDAVMLSNGVSTYVEGSAERPVLVKVELPPSPLYYFTAVNATPLAYYPSDVGGNMAFALVTEPTNVSLTLSAPVEVTSNVTFTVPVNNTIWYRLPNTRRSAVLKYITSQAGASMYVVADTVNQNVYFDDLEGYILSRSDNDSVDWYFTFKNNNVTFELTLIDQETTILCSTETDPLCGHKNGNTVTSQSSNGDTGTETTSIIITNATADITTNETVTSASSFESSSDPVQTDVDPPVDGEESVSTASLHSIATMVVLGTIFLGLVL